MSAAWLRGFRRSRWPRARLVCFPHAGGNAAFYRDWARHLPSDVELYAVQYPGRMDRIAEPSLRAMDPLVRAAAAEVRPLLDGPPLALFGHSLGASVAFEVARRLSWGPHTGRPAALFVSSRPAPHRQRDTAVHLADDDTVWAELSRLGGTSGEVLDHGVLRELTLPALRADYQIAETYRAHPGPPLAAPIVALLGDRDPEVTEAEAAAWADYTAAGFTLRVFPGDHFYLVPEQRELLAELVSRVQAGVEEASRG